MLAMSLLMIDFVALPVLLVALVALLVWYYRRWSAWRAGQRAAAPGAGARKEDKVHAR